MKPPLRLTGLSLGFALVGGTVGYLMLPERAPAAAALTRVRIDGHAIAHGADPRATAQSIARAYLREHVRISAQVTVTEQTGDTFVQRDETRTIDRPRESLGARVDVALLEHLIRASLDPDSPMVRHHEALTPGQPIELPMPVHLDSEVAFPLLMQLKEEVDHAPIDARLDVENHRVMREQPGRYLDVYATLATLDQALARGQTDVPAVIANSAPRILAARLADVRTDAVLGWFETNYNADESKRDRTYNLHLAASRINGYVWMPGEEFDFNQVVGDRSEANGFRMATVISAGELIDGVGGGTCQIAGTLHAASFFAGMEIVDRHPHTRPSGYIKMGLDATVVYPAIDLRMRNNLPFPVVIHTRLGQGLARIELLGARATRTVTFVRKIMHVDRFEERDAPDANLPPGVRVLTQRGIPGFRVRRYRIVREGDQAVRERWEDAYPPTSQIWHVGIGGGTGAAPHNDTHDEYLADQYLGVTEVPGEPHAQEVRRPGTTGTAGWMVREGLSRPLPPSVEQQMADARAASSAHARGAAPTPPPRGRH